MFMHWQLNTDTLNSKFWAEIVSLKSSSLETIIIWNLAVTAGSLKASKQADREDLHRLRGTTSFKVQNRDKRPQK